MLQIILVILTTVPNAMMETITIGYLTGSQRRPGDLQYPRPGLTISGAISLAIDEVNRGPLQLRGYQLNFIVAETFGEERISVQKTAELWIKNISVYIGPQETCEHEAYIAASFNLPMISYFCTHYATSDKKKFPTFARTRPPDTQISKSVASVLVTFNWTQAVFLYLRSPDFEFDNIATTILQTLSTVGVKVVAIKTWSDPYHHGYGKNPFHELVEETYMDTRIYIILGHYYEHLGLMVAMEERKLFDKGEYFVVGADIDQYDSENPAKYMRGLLKDETDRVSERAYENYLGVVPSSPTGFENFTSMVNSYMERPPFNYPNPLIYLGGGNKQIRAEAAYLYDAVHLYAKALINILDSGEDYRNGTAIIEHIKRTHYRSAMGYMVYMDENGDAEGNYTLIARKAANSSEYNYGLFPVGIFFLRGANSYLPVLQIVNTIEWRLGHPPISAPICGFRGEKCIVHSVEITGGVIGGIFFVILLISLALYRNWKYESELDSLFWRVDFKDVQMNEDFSSNSTSGKVSRPNHPLMRTSQVSLGSNPDADFRYSYFFTQIGVYKGRVYAIKRVQKKTVDITREMKKELKLMKDLKHDNLNAFIGACTDPPNICIVTEYCTRGSLRGMIYLHDSAIKFHGALRTSNCLVDSRWVAKVSDFGLREFKMGIEDPAIRDPAKMQERCYKLLYRAPEQLRIPKSSASNNNLHGTQKGDVYSFGIILFELHSRHGPFGDIDLPYGEILNRIVRHNPSEAPFRPHIEDLENVFDVVKECLKECWAEDPDDRPDFKSIRTKLRPLRKGMKPNIFDNMMAMMEKYANNLEVLVDERTHQLQDEKRKTETLLYEMLPRPVAEQLKKGQKVEAENFDCVTIYFSDIVGFTAMSAESTPFEVVDFLNDLYTCFDSIIDNYDVYKVETIGDAYMVVSGLPIRNTGHAAEIAEMSLHLLAEVEQFAIRHRPKEKLMLRIGIHSGPVCAGVVGLKMPRYCLFGDTVNTASRMESTGLPFKIHCSKECKELLTKQGGFHLLERGFVSIKGKGDQQTYWLIGEDTYHYSLRTKERLIKRNLDNIIQDHQPESSGRRVGKRSSLKNKNSTRSLISRCSSFESPKKLRFANGLETQTGILDGHADSKGKTNTVCCSSEAGKTSSTSCPCIENLAIAQFESSMHYGEAAVHNINTNTTCHSFPALYPQLRVSVRPAVHTISAPASPRRIENDVLKFGECEELLTPWTDTTLLLNITQVQDSESII